MRRALFIAKDGPPSASPALPATPLLLALLFVPKAAPSACRGLPRPQRQARASSVRAAHRKYPQKDSDVAAATSSIARPPAKPLASAPLPATAPAAPAGKGMLLAMPWRASTACSSGRFVRMTLLWEDALLWKDGARLLKPLRLPPAWPGRLGTAPRLTPAAAPAPA